MSHHSVTRSHPAALAAGEVTNEGARLAPSCSPNHGKASHFEQIREQCALSERKRRWSADA
jgi:hypothetical protein